MRLKTISGIALTMFLLGILPLAFNVQSVTAPVAVDWWPMSGHDLNHTGYSTSTAPNTNNTIWTYTTGSIVLSSPAVADGKVYVGSDDFKVYCLNASTGVHIWNYTTGSGVFSSPAVADSKVYIGSYDDKVYCLNASTGAHIWNYTTGGYVDSSPAVADGKVYVGSRDHKVYCLNASTGVHIWNYTTGKSVSSSSPAVADGKVYVGSDDNKTYCLNASTGAYIWSYTTGWNVRSSPAVADGKVYVGSFDGKVYAFASSVWSTDSSGNSKFTFDLMESVYVRGQGFPADTNVTIYIIPEEAETLQSNAVTNAFAITSSTGALPATLVWSPPLTLGEYDIWVDVNQNGAFDAGDIGNNQAIGIYGFNVIPELSTWSSTLLILIISTVALATYKRKLLKKPLH